jgi:hypothetical protein
MSVDDIQDSGYVSSYYYPLTCHPHCQCHFLFKLVECTIAGKKSGKVEHQISVSFEKFDVVQALLLFF